MDGTGFVDIIAAERAHVPADIYEVGSMLSYDERLLLHWAARAGNSSGAAIVDAGCFLGGSTLALARGAQARGSRPPEIHVYDLFHFDNDYEQIWVPDGLPFGVGESTMPAFEHHVRDVRHLLTLHPGDMRTQAWDAGPIGVLFIDIAKSWDVGDAVWRTFLPSLVPGESLVIQQDLVHWGHPWCPIVMELLADRFEYLGWTWYSSAVYRAVEPVAATDLPASLLQRLTLDEALELVERAATRLGEPIGGMIRLSGAFVLGAHGDYDAARARIAEVRDAYTDDLVPHISEGYAYLDGWVDDVEAGRLAVDQLRQGSPAGDNRPGSSPGTYA